MRGAQRDCGKVEKMGVSESRCILCPSQVAWWRLMVSQLSLYILYRLQICPMRRHGHRVTRVILLPSDLLTLDQKKDPNKSLGAMIRSTWKSFHCLGGITRCQELTRTT